jgi:hypothetical protein
MRYNSVRDTLQLRGTPLLVGFTDSDWDDDPITWACMKQQAISLSSEEADY